LPVIALGGLELFRRWFAASEVESGRSSLDEPRRSTEQRLPKPAVAAHGLLAVVTVVFVMASVIVG
jgi:hypothetical protein